MTDTYYDLLGVPTTASPTQVKSAYRDLAMVVHPDQGGSAVLFQRVNVAYEVLADPARRRSYDLFLSEGSTDPHDFHRRERHWRAPAEHRPPASAPPPATTTTQRPPGSARVPPPQAREQPVTPQPNTRDPAPDTRTSHIRYLISAAAVSVIGFWVVQILGLLIDGDLNDASDLVDLDRSTWWILALAVINLALALRIRARRGTRQASANAAVATIVSSGLLLLVFVVHGARSDDLGVWAAAVGAALSAVNAARLRTALPDREAASTSTH